MKSPRIEKRVRAILDPQRPQRGYTGVEALAVALVFAGLVGGTASLRIRARQLDRQPTLVGSSDEGPAQGYMLKIAKPGCFAIVYILDDGKQKLGLEHALIHGKSYDDGSLNPPANWSLPELTGYVEPGKPLQPWRLFDRPYRELAASNGLKVVPASARDISERDLLITDELQRPPASGTIGVPFNAHRQARDLAAKRLPFIMGQITSGKGRVDDYDGPAVVYSGRVVDVLRSSMKNQGVAATPLAAQTYWLLQLPDHGIDGAYVNLYLVHGQGAATEWESITCNGSIEGQSRPAKPDHVVWDVSGPISPSPASEGSQIGIGRTAFRPSWVADEAYRKRLTERGEPGSMPTHVGRVAAPALLGPRFPSSHPPVSAQACRAQPRLPLGCRPFCNCCTPTGKRQAWQNVPVSRPCFHVVSPKLAFSAIAVALAAAASAEIDYKLAVKPAEKRLEVTIKVPSGPGPLSIQIPNWSPGAYSYGNFYQNVHDVTATDAKGNTMPVQHPDNNTWTVTAPGGSPVSFHYWVPAGGRRFGGGGGGGAADLSVIQVSGPSTYMYVVGRKKEACKLSVDVPSGWPVMVGLDADGKAPNHFKAPFYDVLADSPISTGDVIVDHYVLRGKDHYIVLEGAAKSEVDRAKLLKDCRFVSAAETDFFGGAPYHKYVWHFAVMSAPDGAGGLEHLTGTQISLASGVGPRAESVLAHEYFHLWNVKRTRPFVLGPFDYIVMPKTGLLWWFEGVTDYYATVIPYRYGEWNQAQLFDGIVKNINAIADNPARLTISPYQASYRVAEANNGRGNSNGYEISYYNLGWLCGLCLDTEIRYRTNGKHNLDEVARALFDECKNDKPGIQEDEIRKQVIRFGGPTLGPFYDQVVVNPGELPIAQQLQKIGLTLKVGDEPFVDTGFTAAPAFGGGGVRVGQVHGPAEGKLQRGDEISSVNGKSLAGMDPRAVGALFQALAANAQVGTPIQLTIVRDGQSQDVSVDPASSTRKVRTVEIDPNASPEAVKLREGYLATKKPAVE